MGDNGAMPLFKTDQQTLFGYIDLTATRDEIFGLFSGRTRAGFPGRASYANQLHTFDWMGNQKAVFNLDQDLLMIAVSPDGRTVYGLGENSVPTVFRYTLPNPTRRR